MVTQHLKVDWQAISVNYYTIFGSKEGWQIEGMQFPEVFLQLGM